MMKAVKIILNNLGFSHYLFQSEPSFKFEMRITLNAALLILESERSELSDISEVCAQVIVKVTCMLLPSIQILALISVRSSGVE